MMKSSTIFFFVIIGLIIVSIAACNPPLDSSTPVADIQVDETLLVNGDTVALDGTGSTDPDGGQLTYKWEIYRQNYSSSSLN